MMQDAFILKSCLLFLTISFSLLADPKATKIMERGEKALRGDSTQSTLTMKIVRPEFTRDLKLRAWATGNTEALVEILFPAKEEGVMSLRKKTEMWNYLPKTDQVVRVPASLMLQSWMGSDFTNDDLMKASSLLRDYNHKILKKLKVQNEPIVMIECKPKPNAPVVWGKVIYWAREKDALPMMQKFYDEKNKWVRTLSFSKFTKMDNRVIPLNVKVTKADAPKEFTIIEYQKILFDRKIDKKLFDKEEIRQASFKGKSESWGWYEKYLPNKGKAFFASPLNIHR